MQFLTEPRSSPGLFPGPSPLASSGCPVGFHYEEEAHLQWRGSLPTPLRSPAAPGAIAQSGFFFPPLD
jgi:hypothetical protein